MYVYKIVNKQQCIQDHYTIKHYITYMYCCHYLVLCQSDQTVQNSKTSYVIFNYKTCQVQYQCLRKRLIQKDIKNESQYYLITACHSSDVKYSMLSKQSQGILFYSVPHRGSPLANLNLPLLRQSIELTEVQKGKHNKSFIIIYPK